MLIKNLLKHTKNITSRQLSFRLQYNVTGEKLLSITKQLVNIDSLQLDKICDGALKNYKRIVQKKEKHKVKNRQEQLLSKTKQQNQNETIEEKIKFLYDNASNANVGFLKGDIHAEFVFKLNHFLIEKSKKQLKKDLQPQQFKKILYLVTQPKHFRLPKKQIRSSDLEDKKNMYQRQLLLQIVSNEQSNQKYDNVLDSLAKVGKVHLTATFRSYLVEWFTPLCRAIKQEQVKCKDQRRDEGKRRIYGEAFVKLSPQRLTLVCLSELLKQITAILYKDFTRQGPTQQASWEEQKQPQFQQYDSIRYKAICLSFAKWVGIQSHYESEQANFKKVMKLYDQLRQARTEEKADLIKKRQQQKIKEKVTHQQKPPEQNFSSPFEQNNMPFSPQVNNSKIEAGTINQDQIQQKIRKKQYEDKLKEIQQTYSQKYVVPEQRKQYLQQMANKLIRDYYKFKSDMSEEVQYQIGAVLIYLMKQVLKTQNKSGFKVPLITLEHKYKKKNGQVLSDRRLKINQHFLNTVLPAIEKEGDLFMHLDRSVPTMIPSMPWVEYEIGGYYLHPTSVMRFSECKVQERLIRYSDLNRVYGVLNYLGQIPWKINKKVLQVVEAIWQEGGEVGQIPKRYSQMITTYLAKLKMESNYFRQKPLLKMIQKLRDEHSLRSDFNLKLNIARSFGKLDRFFYPHNLDFRGRVYPVPPHLNHIGNDLSRGLLMFADGKRLGKSGVKWLKIHCANLMGKDKATLQQKLQFAQANLGLINKIAEEPLKNRQWLEFEDCWQALSAIFELSTALKQSNPQQYVSFLHIHQDGSCNGLQHYAALGRDMEGAYQVNLGPTQRPGDVYTHVAKMVIKMVDNDIANSSSQYHQLAKKVSGNIKRKTIKQTVMTSVYGVTFIGARQQIYRQLKDQHFLKDDDQEYAASIYLAKYTLEAISNLFSSAHLIKKWLISCAKIVADQGNPVGWITPIGLPVVQPYRKQSNLDMVNTIIQSLKLSKKSQNLPVNKSKQKSAFPPNFVHSLDSTHMMYTAEKCMKMGITFAAVHDSYWTHAGTVQKMNELLREEFIRLHSEPLLQNLKKSLQLRYPMLQFPQIPQRGEFNLEKIKSSLYFFS